MKTNTLITILLIVVILAACMPVIKAVPTKTIVLVATKAPIPSQTLILTATANPTNTPAPAHLEFEDIQSGQYLLVLGYEEGNYLYVVSKDNQIVKKLALNSFLDMDDNKIQILNASFDTSDDGTQFVIMRSLSKQSYSLNLVTGKWTKLVIGPGCIRASWSPNKQLIAFSCITKVYGEEINIFDTKSDAFTQITNCAEKYKYCGATAWSTDGHWLAYYQSDTRSGEHPMGIMIFNTKCFATKDCMNQQIGLIKADSNPVWSPNNQLVFSSSGLITYSELKNSEINQLSAYLLPNVEFDNGSTSLRLSPDGNYLAYIPIGKLGVYLYSRLSGKSKILLENQTFQLIGWLSIP